MDIGAVYYDPARKEEEGASSRPVLVVSNSRITGIVLSGIVEKMGLRAVVRPPGDTLEIVRIQQPPVVIVDCDGSDTCNPAEVGAELAALSPRPALVAVAPTTHNPLLSDVFDRVVARPIVPFLVEQAVAELMIERRAPTL